MRTGRYAEPFAMVTAVLAYDQPDGPALSYRFTKLDRYSLCRQGSPGGNLRPRIITRSFWSAPGLFLVN
ncbi:hypothetical protein A9320_15010 [Ruegeria sp. PBVC088]|nr:hypothetical protein A9320_15010 [Ruegeria sp. PBVC088]